MIHNRAELTSFIKQQALSLGFDACGIAKADFLKEDAQFLEQWLSKGFHADMNYLARNKENRVDPRIMVEGCKSIVVVILNYFPALTQSVSQPKISKYAYSKVDYHTVIKSKLKQLEESIRNNFGDECFHPKRQHLFVDSAPVLERRWAQRAGLGWIGKNKMLIHPQFGSFFFFRRNVFKCGAGI